jgi:hypothetical protein
MFSKSATKICHGEPNRKVDGTLDLSSAPNLNFGMVAIKFSGKEVGNRTAIEEKNDFFFKILENRRENKT